MKKFLFFLILGCVITLSSAVYGELTQQNIETIKLMMNEQTQTLRTEIATVKDELKTEITKVRDELKAEIATVKDELKTDIGTVRNEVAYVRGKVEGVEKYISWLMVIIVVALGIPQIIIAWRSRKEREQQKKIEILTQQNEEFKRDIEMLKQQIVKS